MSSVLLRGVNDPLTLRQTQNIIARMVADFRRHNAVADAGRTLHPVPQQVRPKKRRSGRETDLSFVDFIALPKTVTKAWPSDVAEEDEVSVLLPPELRYAGGTLEDLPVGVDPSREKGGEFKLAGDAGSSLVTADDAACGEIARMVEKAEEAEEKETGTREPIKPIKVVVGIGEDDGGIGGAGGEDGQGTSTANERTISSEPVASGTRSTDEALWEEIEALENRAEYWQVECAAARTALFEANERTRRLEEVFLCCAQGQGNRSNPEGGAHVLARLLLNPNARVTLTEALATVSVLYLERMAVLPSAYDSAEKLDDVSTRRSRLLKLLVKLGTEYYDALSGKGDSEARRVFSPTEYSACESETVRSSGLGRLLEFSYNGEHIRMEQHLKIDVAADPAKTLRYYFAWLADEQQIVIRYCGEHLAVASHRT